MSALADRLHNLLSRFASIGKTDVENVIKSVEEHVAPFVEQARTELLADIKALYAEARVDEKKMAAEIAAELSKLFGSTSAPAPVEPPAPQA